MPYFFFAGAQKRSKKGRFYNSPKELSGAALHFGRYRRQSSRSNSRSRLLLDKLKFSEPEAIFFLFALRTSSAGELWLLTSIVLNHLINFRKSVVSPFGGGLRGRMPLQN
jgi:hypothetical protein